MNSINAPAVLLAVGQILLAMTLIITLAGAASMFLRRQPAAKERLWRAALFGVLAAPLVPWISGLIAWEPLTLHLSQETQPIVAAAPIPNAIPITNVSQNTAPVPIPESPTNRITPPPAQPVMMPSPPIEIARNPADIEESNELETVTWKLESLALGLAILWAVGLFYQLVRLAIGSLRCRHLLARATPLDSERYAAQLRAAENAMGTIPPQIVVSSEARGPGVIGLLRSRIVLPAQLLEWAEAETLVQVIIHEAAHIQRRDSVINLLQIAARCLFWPHPLVHWLNHRLREAREEVCDNFVLAHTPASSYAETLLRVAQRCPFPAPSPAGLAMVPHRGSLEKRVADLLDSKRDRAIEWPWPRRLGVQAALLGVLAIVGLVRIESEVADANELATPSATKARNDADHQATSNAKANSKRATQKSITQVTGRVLMPNGLPAEGAEVILLGPPNNGNGYVWPLPIQETLSDQDGRFQFDLTAPGRYELWANLKGLTSRKRSTDGKIIRIKKSGDPPESIELKLHDAVTVRVLVKDAVTGKPVPGATVDLGWSDFTHTFTTDESGVAVVQPLTAERWQLQAFADGHAKQWRWLNLQGGKDANTEFLLEPGVAISGTVRNESGKPMADARVNVRVPGPPRSRVQLGDTDEQGRYRIENVPLARVVVTSSAKGRENARVTIGPLKNDHVVDFTLSPRDYAGSIRGIVVDEQGNPIPGATLINQGQSSAQERKTTTDSDGRFVMNKLFEGISGPYVTVSANSYAPKTVPVDPAPPGNPTEVMITLADGHDIQGRVVDEQGDPIQGVVVYSAGGQGGSDLGGRTKTDEQGRFSFDSLPPKAPFTFVKRGYSEIENRKLPLDSEELMTVVMKTEGMIKGRVIDAKSGEAIKAFNVQITFSPKRQPGEPTNSIMTRLVDPGQTFHSNQGVFKINGLTAGMPFQVTIKADGYERDIDERVVARTDSNVERVTFSLTTVDPSMLTTYAGRLIGPDGQPVAGAQVRLIAATQRKEDDNRAFPFHWRMLETGQLEGRANMVRFEKAITNAKGQFAFPRIPKSAEVELAWWGEEIAPARRGNWEELNEAGRTSIEIQAAKAARIVGTIDRQAYPHVRNLTVFAIEPDMPFGYETEGLNPDETTFEVSNLPPGRYAIRLKGPHEDVPGTPDAVTAETLGSQEVTLDEGEVAQVKFTTADKPIK